MRGPWASDSGGQGGERRDTRALAPGGWGHDKVGPTGQWHGRGRALKGRARQAVT
jgi:hypothetical protein